MSKELKIKLINEMSETLIEMEDKKVELICSDIPEPKRTMIAVCLKNLLSLNMNMMIDSSKMIEFNVDTLGEKYLELVNYAIPEAIKLRKNLKQQLDAAKQ